uniref:DNA dC->dU-editing enzyme APOBEC-3G n=2 Tax=Pteropus alecto TaxID=9402 RepID=A0A2R2Z4E7_PTEAL|nr:apolipoprotein B mRNA editing enzyme catalytic polypeptide-like 3Z1c isomer A [Pteropus alecto]ASK05221.1 apolipoprotein B mRNA editing enzyme catalytic polypeptide-like 3Z1c isomer A [Pteropus alecto]
MEAGPAPEARLLMDKQTFLDNFSNLDYPRKTYLCYEVELLVGENSIPLDEYKGFLHNKGADMGLERCHAEPIFLERMASWNLDTELHYRITVFISWSPCPDCADELVKFLRENRHVNLRIFAARIYDYLQGYEAGLRALKAAGTDVAMMTFQEFEYCWKNFVDHQQDEDESFPPWDNLDVESEELTKNLEGILQNQED